MSLKRFSAIILCCVSLSVNAQNFPAYQSEVLTDQLTSPWAVAALPGDRLVISERVGAIRLWQNGELTPAIDGVPDVFFKGQGGLLDVKPHPNFSNNSWLYFTYATGDDAQNALRLSRATLSDNRLTDIQHLLTVSPMKDTPVHYGGRIAFLDDGSLLVTSGDGFDYREQAQSLNNLLGKVIRINDDGSIPQDNPFVKDSSKRSEIWSYGHRNPQGLVYDSTRSLLFEHEHGPAGGDEINIIEAGKNYGWPVITYGKDYSGATISPFTEYQGMELPMVNWTPSIAPSGMVVYRGKEFSDLDGDLLVTTLKDRNLRWLQIEGRQVKSQATVFSDFSARLRDIALDHDGIIYLITDAGSLIKITKQMSE
jgi:glucose/arabinose dehydrogenase